MLGMTLALAPTVELEESHRKSQEELFLEDIFIEEKVEFVVLSSSSRSSLRRGALPNNSLNV
jgi:hypothetical protein